MLNVMLCVNERNGDHGGRCCGIDLLGIRVECDEGFRELEKQFRFGRRKFDFFGVPTRYVGNICWDSYRMTPAEACRLLEYARSERATCVEAPVEFYDAWHNGKPLWGRLEEVMADAR